MVASVAMHYQREQKKIPQSFHCVIDKRQVTDTRTGFSDCQGEMPATPLVAVLFESQTQRHENICFCSSKTASKITNYDVTSRCDHFGVDPLSLVYALAVTAWNIPRHGDAERTRIIEINSRLLVCNYTFFLWRSRPWAYK